VVWYRQPWTEITRYFDLRTGRELLDQPVLPVAKFHDGLAPARVVATGKLGYMDRLGRLRIAARYDRAGPFCDGRAVVAVAEGEGIIDITGEWVTKPGTYEQLGFYREGLCAFRVKDRWGFLDREGRVQIPPGIDLTAIPCFSEGLCAVGQSYLDKQATTVIKLDEVVYCYDFREGRARIAGRFDGQWWYDGFIDRSGRMVIPPIYAGAGNFSEGLAPVSLRDRSTFRDDGIFEPGEKIEPPPLWGFIDLNGKLVIPMQYHEVRHFRNGLAPFIRDRGWGYMDKTGKVVLPEIYELANSFENGVARVVLDGRVVFIDTSGRILVKTDMVDY